jgi:sugar-specific transcriptional regulator TrmB
MTDKDEDEDVLEDLSEFFKMMNLSNYEIDCYITLLNSEQLAAREVTKESGVPIGRVYDVLMELEEKGLIEIQEGWPKLYKAVKPLQASYNLVMHQIEENKRKEEAMLENAKRLEKRLHQSDLCEEIESSKLFWSITYGTPSIISTYLNSFKEVEEELLLTGFINEYTLKIIPWTKPLFEHLSNARERDLKIKYLFSFEYDTRSLTDELKQRCDEIFIDLKGKVNTFYSTLLDDDTFELRYLYRTLPNYIDIVDGKRALLKLQNPMNRAQFFACINILDPTFAAEVREQFLNLWHLESRE